MGLNSLKNSSSTQVANGGLILPIPTQWLLSKLKAAFGIKVGIPVRLDSLKIAKSIMLAANLDGTYLDYRDF